jgi:hypothetical protein
MKHMAILAIVLGTVLASSLFLLSGTFLRAEATVKDANQVEKFLSISNTSTEVKRWWNGEQIVSLMDSKVKVRADIPLDGLSGTFGYAWLTDDLNNVLALVSHLPIDESSYEIPGPGLYAYVLDMKAATADCAGYDLELDIQNSLANPAFDADYEWSVDDNRLRVSKVPTADLADTGVEKIVAIKLASILSEEVLTNVCVDVIENPYHGL